MAKRTTRKIEAALDALPEQATVADLAQRYQAHPNQFYAWKKQLLAQAARAFENGNGHGGAPDHEHEIERLHARIGQCGRGFFSQEVWNNERPGPRRAR